jgi:hypothetical protein
MARHKKRKSNNPDDRTHRDKTNINKVKRNCDLQQYDKKPAAIENVNNNNQVDLSAEIDAENEKKKQPDDTYVDKTDIKEQGTKLKAPSVPIYTSHFEERKKRLYMKGDLVIIASDRSVQRMDKYNADLPWFSVVGSYGHITDFSGHSIEKMDNVLYESNLMLNIKILNGPYGPNRPWYDEIKILHSDVVNLSVLGDNVGKKLFDVSRDKKFQSLELKEYNIVPQSYTEYALDLSTDFSKRSEIKRLQFQMRYEINKTISLLKEEFKELNRKLRWKVTYFRLNGLPSIPGLDDFDGYPDMNQKKPAL